MKEIIRRIKEDDLTAVTELYEKVKSTGMKVAVSYVGQEGLEEDMFHEAFIKALENIDKFDVERSFQSWFDVILANTCKSYLRKKKPVNLQDLQQEETEEDFYFGEVSDIGNPEDCWNQKELEQIIKDLLEKLSPEQKEAIILHYYQNMSVAGIAEFQKCSEDTVKSRLFQGRNKLKAVVEAYEKKSDIKLHSIALIPALYVFFKSSMGDAYACQYMAGLEEAAAEAGKVAAEETAKEAVKKAAKEGTEEVVKEAAKEAVAEVAKSAAMKLSTKILIGVVALALVGGTVAVVTSMNKDENSAGNVVVESSMESVELPSEEASSEEVIVESSEEFVESSEEILVEESEAPEESEDPHVDYPMEEGITVHPIENGVRKLTADNNIIGFTAANGGVILTNDENYCGAIDYYGHLLVERKYLYYSDVPDCYGNFALGDGQNIDIYNKDGKLVYTIPNWQSYYSLQLSEGYLTYTTYDINTCVATVYCYDIENDTLVSNQLPEMSLVYVKVGDMLDGKYIYFCGEPGGEEYKGIYYGTADGTLIPMDDESFCVFLHGNPNGGYVLGTFTEFPEWRYIYTDDFSSGIQFGLDYSAEFVSYLSNGNFYYNKGKKFVTKTYDSELGLEKYWLVDLENYTEGDAIETYIVAKYDYISLSSTGICYASDENGNFFMYEDGTRIEDAYVDHSQFADNYAAVLDANGLAYFIDADMNVLTEGVSANSVYLRGMFPVAQDDAGYTQTIFVVD